MGATTGIGREIALQFSSAEAEIIALGWGDEGNQQTADIIASRGGSCVALEADVSAEDDIVSAFSKADRIDVLVNNATSTKADGRISDLSGEAWDRVLAIYTETIRSESSAAFYKQRPEIDISLRALYPADALGHVQDVAVCALFLASGEATSSMGAAVPVNGGLTATRRSLQLGQGLPKNGIAF